MVTLEQLQALDLVQWLGTTERAAQLACTNQSTISRRSRAVQHELGFSMVRRSDAWRTFGDTRLLQLERQVHQWARLQGRQPLRLQVPFWTRTAALRHLPRGWCANPIATDPVCDNPVHLLRERIIDACLITPTQIPSCSEDLVLLDLVHRPIELTVFAGGPWPLERGSSQQLRLLPFLPASCRDRSREWFEALLQGGAAPSHHLCEPGECMAFLTPEMRLAQDRPWRVDVGFEPYPYVERLAVLAEHAHEVALQRLQNDLLERFASVAVA